ncbi:class I SAM-dependent methyltransferase [Hydrogenophaga pseudoflava]|uniref:class I SAM-dependent methyltransferase n=1 Tax=Hydrogenophaga pseudoflava TaxID=47421 RepID=UPI0027E557B3|nr:class I SAM-dependent methyltransferase [Hydrogenophaga pseudoflava]MDQ7747311.1 class I SAM-dependent methyltransferase [Hydrogenophaga pseudoflava]
MTVPRAEMPLPPPFVFDDPAAYELMMGRWSALVAEPFLDWLALPPGLAWLDDGCGNGSFTETLLRRQSPATVVGVDPSPEQLAFARRRAATVGVRFLQGDAQALPLNDASVDAGVMALVLFFLSDPRQGIRELVRVTRPGGTIAAYHWDMAGGGFPLQPVLDAARADGYEPQKPPSVWAASLQASEELWQQAGLLNVRTAQIEVCRDFDSFDDFWLTAQGNPRLRNFFASLLPCALQRLKGRVREQLGVSGGGPFVLKARANAVQGHKRHVVHSPRGSTAGLSVRPPPQQVGRTRHA